MGSPTLLEVLEAGFLATVQDQGRRGWERFGVPVSGAMDWFALAAANRLVGNSWDAAGIETAYQDLALNASGPCLVAAAGPGWSLRVRGEAFPSWTSVYVPAGSRIELVNEGDGLWGYLAFSGGIAVPAVLGSRSTYLRGGFGGHSGRALRPGDLLPLSSPDQAGWLQDLAGQSWPLQAPMPEYTKAPTIEVIPGPQLDRFPPAAVQQFFSHPYRVAVNSDRMAYRLEGEPLDAGGRADILSEGLAPGVIQVPADGLPIVMLSDRQTTGGYRKIAAAVRADIPILAQSPPGTELRFQETTLDRAQARFRALFAALRDFDPQDGG